MDLNQTPLSYEIDKIVKSAKPVRYEYTATLHSKTADVPVMKVVSMDIVSDYVNNIGNVVYIEFLMPLGVYIQTLYPSRNNLEVSVYKRLLPEIGVTDVANSILDTERFKAVFLPKYNMAITGNELAMLTDKQQDLAGPVTVQLQLLNRSLEPIRVLTTGGVYNAVTAYQLMHSIIGHHCQNLLVDGKASIGALDIVTPDNTDVKQTVVIPHGTLVTSIPTMLQERFGGVYNAGIGTFLQPYRNINTIFIYPLFNTKRFAQSVPKLVLFSGLQHRQAGMERTYRKEGDVLYILGTSGKQYIDDGELDFMNEGVGFRMADANAFMKKPVVTTPNGPLAQRGRLNTEVALKNRADNLDYAPNANKGISINAMAQYSRVLQRNGARMDFVWENANHREVYPGMPCKLVFMESGRLIEATGVVLFNHALIQMTGQGIASRSHTTTCNLSLFLEKIAAV